MNRRRQTARYIAADLIAALLTWVLFFSYRKYFIEETEIVTDRQFYLGIVMIPFYWLLLYYLSGFYDDVYRKSRLREFIQTLGSCFFGVLILFFILLLDDEVGSYKDYYYTFGTLFGLQFILTWVPRLLLTSQTVRKIRRKEIGFNTILVGKEQKAAEIYEEIESESEKHPEGYLIKGYVSYGSQGASMLPAHVRELGRISEIKSVIEQHQIEEVILALESSEHHLLNEIINLADDGRVKIKITPDMYDIISGTVKMNHIFGAVLIEVKTELMPAWQRSVKRAMDVSISLLALILGSPVYLFLALAVKLGSKGPVFFAQERIGYMGKPFKIYKFRTMVVDAEAAGPQLSRREDPRITRIGVFLRRSRLDELPQFYNVLKGDMSVVGPRPERRFFIDQIIQRSPHYVHLHKVKPGITSWGQVKYGYAENVDQMIQRLKFDLLYIENMSIAMDLRIIIYTILIMIQGRGK